MMAPSEVDSLFWIIRGFRARQLSLGKWIKQGSVEQEHSISRAEKSPRVLLASGRFPSSILLSTQVADVPQKRGKITKRGNSHRDKIMTGSKVAWNQDQLWKQCQVWREACNEQDVSRSYRLLSCLLAVAGGSTCLLKRCLCGVG